LLAPRRKERGRGVEKWNMKNTNLKQNLGEISWKETAKPLW
jgi:hypothetical protein